MLKPLRKLACWLRGHDDLVVREPSRLFFHCSHCDRDSNGWLLDLPAPRPR